MTNPYPQNPPPQNPYDPPPAPPGYPQGGYPPPGYPPAAPPVYPRLADGTPISPWGPCAAWVDRFIARLWDMLYMWPGYAVMLVAVVVAIIASALVDTDAATPLFVLAGALYLVAFGVLLWRSISNLYLTQGRTGQSYGKRKTGLHLVREMDGRPPGGLICFVRYLLGGLINQIVLLDVLWPLWDPKRQTLSDKLLGLIVVVEPRAPQPPRPQLR